MSRAKAALTPPEHPPWAGDLGRRLREVRQERGLSLAKVSKATGISTSFLALLERGQTDISLGRLLPLLEFFGLSAADVLAWNDAERDRVVRAGEAPFLFSVAKGIDVYLAAPDRRRPFLPMIAVYRPGARMTGYSEHEGDEFVYVLEGSLRIEFRDEDPLVLDPGDALFFSSQRPHRIATEGKAAARVLVVTTEHIGGLPEA